MSIVVRGGRARPHGHGMAARLGTLLSIAFLAVAASGGGAGAQSRGATDLSLLAGATLRIVDADAIGGDAGVHVAVAMTRWASSRHGWRGDVTAHFFPSSAVALASCPPVGSCPETRSLSLAASATVSAVAGVATGGGRVSVFGGPGVYWAGTHGPWRRGDGIRSHAALGLHSGVGVSVGAAAGWRLGAEVRAHTFPNGLGELRWLFTPALTLAF